MADLFDKFIGAAGPLSGHTADSLDTWPTAAVNVSLDGFGQLYGNNASPSNGIQPLSSWTPPGADYAVALVIGSAWVSGPDAGGYYGLIARGSGSVGSLTYYTAIFFGTSPPQFQIYRVDSGNAGTQLGSTQNFGSVADNDLYTLTVVGSSPVTLTFFQNGTQLYQTTDSSGSQITSAGSAGIWTQSYNPSHTDQVRLFWAGAVSGPVQTISPSSAVVALSGTQSFTAAVQLAGDETLNWTATYGSISGSPGATVTYTAPASGTTDTITWTSYDLPGHTASALITLGSPPAGSPAALLTAV
jgi:hypothetical protein